MLEGSQKLNPAWLQKLCVEIIPKFQNQQARDSTNFDKSVLVIKNLRSSRSLIVRRKKPIFLFRTVGFGSGGVGEKNTEHK
jgi:hypothetical protein